MDVPLAVTVVSCWNYKKNGHLSESVLAGVTMCIMVVMSKDIYAWIALNTTRLVLSWRLERLWYIYIDEPDGSKVVRWVCYWVLGITMCWLKCCSVLWVIHQACGSFYDLRNTTMSFVRTISITKTAVTLDNVCPGAVTLLVVCDTVQIPDIIISRTWLNFPEVEYYKVSVQLWSLNHRSYWTKELILQSMYTVVRLNTYMLLRWLICHWSVP